MGRRKPQSRQQGAGLRPPAHQFDLDDRQNSPSRYRGAAHLESAAIPALPLVASLTRILRNRPSQLHGAPDHAPAIAAHHFLGRRRESNPNRYAPATTRGVERSSTGLATLAR